MANIGDIIPGSFIVVLQDGTYMKSFEDEVNHVDDRDAKLFATYHAIPALCVALSAKMVEKFDNDSKVAYVEPDRVVGIWPPETFLEKTSLEATAAVPSGLWGLNRVCERNFVGTPRPYRAPATGKDITAYVVDTGVYVDRDEFNGRASFGANFVWGSEEKDENGHGTHVAGTIGGTTYGVAKEVSIVGVKVLDAKGHGSTSTLVDGLNWVYENATSGKSVVNISAGGGKSRAIDDMIARLYDLNIPVFAAAGNDAAVNSSDGSPAGSPCAYTVGSMNWKNQLSTFSSRGKNVDIFAPGERILSAYIGEKDASEVLDGTSMATPHVTGIAAIYLNLKPGLDVKDVYKSLSENATNDQLSGDFSTGDQVSGTFKKMPNSIVYNNLAQAQ